MALKSYNPVTPSQRQLVLVDRSSLHKGAPISNGAGSAAASATTMP